MHFERSAGVLLHVTSLPGACGIGDLGSGAFRFVDWLAEAGQSWWQVLPLGLPGERDANIPYYPQSSWAGSPLYVSFEELVKAGDLTAEELRGAKVAHAPKIKYAGVKALRRKLLTTAAKRFFGRQDRRETAAYKEFCRRESYWLEDWALFAAAKKHFPGKSWWQWPQALSQREVGALKTYRRELAESIAAEKYIQFRFFEQWDRLRSYAKKNGVRLIGDVPVYCAHDSADIWANRNMFKVDRNGKALRVGGVPPDYFSKTGQLWGNPVYNWPANRADRYRWWIARLKGLLRTVDVVRVDHFLGFNRYYEISARAKTAINGRWVKGPGDDLFKAIHRALGDVPFIAEDLGVITPEVIGLRDRWHLPGMRVLQFAFGGDPRENIHLPIWHTSHSVVYPGTHDNDTCVGWYKHAGLLEKHAFRRYAGSDGRRPHFDMTRLAFASVANLAVVAMQDVLGLDSSARLNTPGVIKDNFNYLWKLVPAQLSKASALRLRDLTVAYGRLAR